MWLSSSEDRKKAKDLGAVDFIIKADHLPEEVYEIVDRLTDRIEKTK